MSINTSFQILIYILLLSIAVINTDFRSCGITRGEYNLTGYGCSLMVELTSSFVPVIIKTPTPSTYKPYQAAVDIYSVNRTDILLSVVAPNSAPAEFGLVDVRNGYTTLYGDVNAGNSEGILDGQGKAARIREIRCFTQSADGFIYFGDRYVIRKVDRSSGNVTSLLGDPGIAIDNITSFDTITFDNINGIVYDNDTDLLYVNTDTLGLLKLDFTNKVVRVVIPLSEISSPDSNDYGADVIFSPDKLWLYMKVSQGVSRYPVSMLSSEVANINYTDARWISSIDRTAHHMPEDLTFGSTFFGRLGFSPSGRYLLMVDHEQKYIYLFDTETGGAASLCDRGHFKEGNLSTCSFTEPYSLVWLPTNSTDGSLNIFHYYSASRSNRTNYMSIAGTHDSVQEQTTVSTTQSTPVSTYISMTSQTSSPMQPGTQATKPLVTRNIMEQHSTASLNLLNDKSSTCIVYGTLILILRNVMSIIC